MREKGKKNKELEGARKEKPLLRFDAAFEPHSFEKFGACIRTDWQILSFVVSLSSSRAPALKIHQATPLAIFGRTGTK